MRPVDGSTLINRPDAPDNKRVRPGKWLAADSMEKAAHYLYLDDFSPDENGSRIREARYVKKPRQIESALTMLPLLPTVPSAQRTRSNSDFGRAA